MLVRETEPSEAVPHEWLPSSSDGSRPVRPRCRVASQAGEGATTRFPDPPHSSRPEADSRLALVPGPGQGKGALPLGKGGQRGSHAQDTA